MLLVQQKTMQPLLVQLGLTHQALLNVLLDQEPVNQALNRPLAIFPINTHLKWKMRHNPVPQIKRFIY